MKPFSDKVVKKKERENVLNTVVDITCTDTEDNAL